MYNCVPESHFTPFLKFLARTLRCMNSRRYMIDLHPPHSFPVLIVPFVQFVLCHWTNIVSEWTTWMVQAECMNIYCIHTSRCTVCFQAGQGQTGSWVKYWDMIPIELRHIWQWPLGQTWGCALTRGERLVAWIQYVLMCRGSSICYCQHEHYSC